MSDFEHRVTKELGLIHRQLGDHSQMLGELKIGQQKLEAGQKKLEGEISEVRADIALMDHKLSFICNFIRKQLEDEGED